MAREFRTGFKITGDPKGGVQASRAMRSELDQLNRSVEKGTASNKLSVASMAKYSLAAAGMASAAAAVVLGAVRFAAAVAQQGDRIQKLSIQLGTSTEFISSMGYAADLSGSSLDQFATATAKMQKSVADLGAGLSTQQRAFDRLGLTYEDIRKLSPEDQFSAIAERLGSLQDATTRTATAMDIFGRSGAQLIPLLEGFAEKAAAARAEQERFGSLISKEFADQSAQFTDELRRGGEFVTGIKVQIAEGLLPSLTALSQSFLDGVDKTEAWTKAGEFLGNMVRLMVALFITLKETVVLTAEAIWAAGKVIIETLVAIAAPVVEFGNTLSTAFNALVQGEFKQAAAAFSGLGDRMASAFVDNITVVGDTLKEFGGDAKDRIVNAVDAVNEVLLRQATISQDTAEGMREVGEDTAKAGQEADKAARAFEKLVDRLDPLTALQRQFTVEQAILLTKIAEGGDGVDYYTQLLGILREQYAAAARDAVGYADESAKAADKAASAAEDDAARRGRALAQQQQDLETFGKAFARGIERMDDLTVELWKGFYTRSKNALDLVKDFFLNWLAELSHAAFTRPILVNFVSALGLGAPTAALAGTSGTVGGLGTVAGQAGGVGGFGGIGGLAGLFTGSGIGLGFQNLPTWLGGTNAGLSTSAGGLFGNAAAYANWQYGGAGILGGLLGQEVFGGYGGVGGSLGATIGLAAAGPIGAAVGAVLGGFVGGLFGGNKQPVLDISGFSQAGQSGSDDDRVFDSALGQIFTRSRRIDDATVGQIGQALVDFDNQLAQFLTKDQIDAAAARLETWELHLEDSAISLEKYLQGRFSVVLSTVSQDIQDYVNSFSGLEQQVERFGLATLAERIISSAPELFEGKTFRDFVDAAERMQAEGEELTATFDRLVKAVIVITDQLALVRGFAGSDLASDYSDLLAQQGATPQSLAAGFADEIRSLASSFSGSADDLRRLSTLVAQRYDAEIAYLLQIDSIIAGISAGSQGLREQIQRDQLTDEQFYEHVTNQANQLAALLEGMTDPAQIAATVAEIQRLSGVAYGLLDESQRADLGQGFIDFLDAIEAKALEQITAERDAFLGESAELRALVTEMAAGFGDPLDLAAEHHERAADSIEVSAAELESSAEYLGDAAGSLGSAAGSLSGAAGSLAGAATSLASGVRSAVSELRELSIPGPAGAPTFLTVPPPPSGGSVLSQANQALQQGASAIRAAGLESVQAIRQVQSPTFVLQQARRGSVTD